MLSQTSTLIVTAASAAEGHGEAAVNPWLIGGGTLAILLFLLIALVAFGGGREHS